MNQECRERAEMCDVACHNRKCPIVCNLGISLITDEKKRDEDENTDNLSLNIIFCRSISILRERSCESSRTVYCEN